MASPRREARPYESALDLPSVVEMRKQLRGAKVLTRVIAKKQRPKLLEIERDLDRLCKLVDGFYSVLGDRNWIFHDNLNVEKITGLVGLSASEAERKLIDLYKDRETLEFMIRSSIVSHSFVTE
jgi:hypothetical protein